MFSSTRRGRFERLENRTLFSLSHFLVDTSLQKESVDSALISLPEISGLRAASVELTYNQDAIKIDPKSLRAGTIWGNRGLAIANVDEEAGRIVAFIFASREVPAGAGSLLEFDFAHNDLNPSEKDQIEFVIETISLNEGKIEFVPEGEGTAEITWSAVQNLPDSSNDESPHESFAKPPLQFNPKPSGQPTKTVPSRPSEISVSSKIPGPNAMSISPAPQSALLKRPYPDVSPRAVDTATSASWSPIPQAVYGPEELRPQAPVDIDGPELDSTAVPTHLQFPWFENSKPAVYEPFDRIRAYEQPTENDAWLVDHLWSLPQRGSPKNTTVFAPDCWYLMEPVTDAETSLREVLPPVLPSPAISL